MPSRKLVSGDLSTNLTRSSISSEKGSDFSFSYLSIFLVITLFCVYHGYHLYNETQDEIAESEEKGAQCLERFKLQGCNPMNMTD
jgi:hypothetical protein